VLVVPMMLAGFGTSFALTGTTTTVMSSVPGNYSGTASAWFNTARQVGSAAGVALGGSLLAGAADFTTGVRTSMAVGAVAYLTAAALALFCIPRRQQLADMAKRQEPNRQEPNRQGSNRQEGAS
jgi:DHA2 family methylenomycin A resistance protein-like MFS transporter